MSLASPAYLLLLLLLIPYIVWHYLFEHKHMAGFTIATTEAFRKAPTTWRVRLIHLPFWLRVVSFTLIILILARPQTRTAMRSGETEGIDIMMAMDISTSMLISDIRPNRLTAAKEVALKFINNRPDDNIGLTLFAGEAFTQCPLTTDHGVLVRMFQNVTCDLQASGVIQPGTAIGMGISSAVAHLTESKAKSKVIILLTDGENNTGEISPLMAAEMAKNCKIRVYTILLGTNAKVNVPVATLPNGETYEQQVEASTDPSTLKQIAQTTGGIFYQATSKTSLQEVYDDIDKLEKSKLKIINYDQRYEAYQPFAWMLLVTLLLELLLRTTWLRRQP